MKHNIRITCAQIHSIDEDKAQNIKIMKSYMDKAMADYPDTDLIVFPELALTGCVGTAEKSDEIAESLKGPSITELAAYAKEKKVHLVFGFIEKDEENGNVYNSSVLIDNHGAVLGQYQKMHLVEIEKSLASPGDTDYPVFDTEIGKIGMMICWDSAFPEAARSLALKGADYIVIPAAWESPMQADWDLVQSARAFDNVIFTACCNQAGHHEFVDFFGRSKIIGPTGQVLSDVVDDKEAIVSAAFDFEEKTPLREGYYALLNDRRPDTYTELVRSK